MPTFGQTVTYRDDKGQTSTVRFFVVANATQALAATAAAALIALMTPLTNAAVQAVRGPSNLSPVGVVYGTNAEFENVEDKAEFTYETAAGSIHRYQIPAPKASIFLADGETIDYTNSDVAAFDAAVKNGNYGSRDGTPITLSIGGSRKRVKIQRKFNVITRNPTLTGQGL